MAPPLIVGFIEISNSESGVRKNPQKALLLFIIAIICSISLRLALNVYLSIPIVVPAMVSSIIILAAMKKSGIYFPPVGAMALLPMIIDYKLLGSFLIQASIGCILLITIAMNLFGKTELAEA